MAFASVMAGQRSSIALVSDQRSEYVAVRVQGFETAPQEPVSEHVRVGAPVNPVRHVAVATSSAPVSGHDAWFPTSAIAAHVIPGKR